MQYNNCPKCGTTYKRDQIDNKNIYRDFFVCKKCNFIFYNNPKPAVVGLIYNIENKLLLVKRKIKPYVGYWDLPGGFVNANENPSRSIVREIKEELNLDAKIINIENTFTENYKNKGRNDEQYNLVVIAYNLSILSFKNVVAMDDISDYKFFSIYNLPKKIAFPEKREFLNGLAKQRG